MKFVLQQVPETFSEEFLTKFNDPKNNDSIVKHKLTEHGDTNEGYIDTGLLIPTIENFSFEIFSHENYCINKEKSLKLWICLE